MNAREVKLVKCRRFEENLVVYKKYVDRSHRREAAQAKKEAESQGDVVQALRRDLAGAAARMSDMAGELSDKQKQKLEQYEERIQEQDTELEEQRKQLEQLSALVDEQQKEINSREDRLTEQHKVWTRSGHSYRKESVNFHYHFLNISNSRPANHDRGTIADESSVKATVQIYAFQGSRYLCNGLIYAGIVFTIHWSWMNPDSRIIALES